jgi:hypothetical protein
MLQNGLKVAYSLKMILSAEYLLAIRTILGINSASGDFVAKFGN